MVVAKAATSWRVGWTRAGGVAGQVWAMPIVVRTAVKSSSLVNGFDSTVTPDSGMPDR